MTAFRKAFTLDALMLGAVGVSTVATAILVAFPGNRVAWQVGSWTLAVALATLSVLVLASGYSLAVDRTARNWRRAACFLLGLSCLALVALGSR